MTHNSEMINHETTPLLRPDSKSGVLEPNVHEVESTSRRRKLKQAFRVWEVSIICGLVVFLADLGTFIYDAPCLREAELMVCREHYMKANPSFIDDHGDVPERFCKTDSISQELAILRGTVATLDNVSAIIVAVPFGLLADRYSRRLIITVALIGEMLAVAWQLIVFSNYHVFGSKALMSAAAFRLIGGGSPIIAALVMALFANSIPPERRSQAFFYLMAAIAMAELAGTSVASLLMTKASNWTALMVGYAIMLLCTPLIWLVPEKPIKKTEVSVQAHDASNRTREAGSLGNADENTTDAPRLSSQLWQKWQSTVTDLRSLRDLLFHNRNVLFGLLAFLTSRLSPQLVHIMPQYVSKRYGWSIAQANYLNTFRAIIELLVLTLLLPLLTSYLHQPPRHYSGPRTDILVARFSAISLAIGALICGAAAIPAVMVLGLFCFTVGHGYRAALQSFMSQSVAASSMARLYVAVSVIDTVGNLVAAPLLAVTLARGIRAGGERGIGGLDDAGGGVLGKTTMTPLSVGEPDDDGTGERGPVSRWIGLPYLVAAVAFLVTWFCTMTLSVKEAEGFLEVNRREEEGGDGGGEAESETDEDEDED